MFPQLPRPGKPHIPSCVAYSVEEILRDLLAFAAQRLRVGGRLVYWMPTTDRYRESDLPLHPCLEIIANSEQPLTARWRRRLITMVKITEYDANVHDKLEKEQYGQIDPAHANLKSYVLQGLQRNLGSQAVQESKEGNEKS